MALVTFKELADQYCNEIEEAYTKGRMFSLEMKKFVHEHVKNAENNFRTLEPRVKANSGEIVKHLRNIADMNEPVSVETGNKLFPTFSWLTVMHIVHFASMLLSAYILYPLISLTFGTFWSVISAYGILPLYAYYHIKNEQERVARFKLLAFAFAEGLLTGYLFSHRYLSTIQPLFFITPLAIAALTSSVCAFLGENSSRFTLLHATLGLGFSLHLLLGFLFGQLSFPYMLLSLLYEIVSFFGIQCYLNKLSTQQGLNDLDQISMLYNFVAAIFAQAFVFFIFGGPQTYSE